MAVRVKVYAAAAAGHNIIIKGTIKKKEKKEKKRGLKKKKKKVRFRPSPRAVRQCRTRIYRASVRINPGTFIRFFHVRNGRYAKDLNDLFSPILLAHIMRERTE